MIEQYFQNILKKFTGDTTEASFYSTLENFIQEISKSKNINNITITQQPKRLSAGTPDFTIRRSKELIGYIEAKDIGIHLDDVENDKQIEKYKNEFDNFILTNYFDFWLWRRNEKEWILKVNTSVGELTTLKANQAPPIKNEQEFLNLIETFFRFAIPERKSAKSLAIELAIKAKLIPSFIIEELNNNVETEIDRVYKAFKEYLIPDLSKEDFADIYAQTITYGLFMARLRHKSKDFNRFLAQQYIPQNIQILRDTFSLISGYNLPKSIDWIVDGIATILAYADIEQIREELYHRTGEDDPVIHFYETFLKEYNPKEKKHRGVYYTPLPVVSYITRSTNILLKEKFNKNLGFANDGITLLDPASGTLTFPANAIRIAKEEIDKSSSAGSWLQIVKNHLLKDYYAFELLMAPYIIGHLKISLLLEDLGYKLEDSDKIKLYLTNTLDLSEPRIQGLPAPGLVYSLTEEAKKAKEVKEKIPILVVMGNPPYSVSSSNIIKEESDFRRLYESYKEKVRKEEKNIQPLSDDYIKFIAFAHWKIKQAEQGIVGMITNNSYLDGLIHRDMRRKLAEDFDEIYLLNLHGNSKRQEKVPKEVQKEFKIGEKDENVFDIQQGVGIILLVKTGRNKKAIVKYADLWGLREEKYKFLVNKDIKSTYWQELELKEPHYFFAPKNFSSEENYDKFISLKDIFDKFNAGIATGKDEVLVDFNEDSLIRKLSITDKDLFENTMKNYKVKDELIDEWYKELKEGNIEEQIKKYNYRIFDKRFIIYNNKILQRARDVLMRHLLKDNISLVTTKILSSKEYKHVSVSDCISDRCFISNRGREANYFFPLYFYGFHKKFVLKGQKHLDMLGVQKELDEFNREKKSNIKEEIIKELSELYKKQISTEEIFYYIYGVLYSNLYRKQYEEFLKIDFPKIPFTKDKKLFYKISVVGKELIDLHLLKLEKLNKLSAAFPVSTGDILTDGKVEKREYNLKEKRVYINEKQYFEEVEPGIWNYYIGGYQVLDKWLKDRLGRKLSSEAVNHYLKIITTIKYTINLQKEIDKLYPEIEKNLIEFNN